MASRIEEARKELGMTQEELAAKIGVQRSWITHLENRKINPTLQNLLAVTRVLKKPVGYFFDPRPGRKRITAPDGGKI